MSALTKILSAAGITLVFAMPALAQQGNPWEMEEGTAHVVDMQGKMKKMEWIIILYHWMISQKKFNKTTFSNGKWYMKENIMAH